jgi:hypothetical protein
MPYDNKNTGILSANDKAGNEKRPDYRGFLDVDGKAFELSGWIRRRKSDNKPFLSLTVQPAKPKPAADPGAAVPGATPPPAQPPPADEALPF